MECVSQQVTVKVGFLGVERRPLCLLLLAQRASAAKGQEKTRVAYFTVLPPTEAPVTQFIHAHMSRTLKKLGSRH